MRVQCDVCEKALAEVVCCADEAVLCAPCDQRVHAANKLASKHQRLRLVYSDSSSAPSPFPCCDICQEKGAFIFCLEDRALLCRDCDVGIHAANSLAAKHQRFLATGVRVALESKDHPADNGDAKKPEAPQPQPPATGMSVATVSTSNGSSHPSYSGESAQHCIGANELRGVEKSFKHPEDWQNTESLDLGDLDPNYSLNELEFSKALLNDDWTMDLSVFNDHIYGDFAEVPDASLSMYPPISHGSQVVSKVKQRRDVPELVPDFDDDVFVVPDLSPTSFHAPHVKKRRFFTGI